MGQEQLNISVLQREKFQMQEKIAKLEKATNRSEEDTKLIQSLEETVTSLKEEKTKTKNILDYYISQLQRRESNAAKFKDWRDEWYTALTEQMDLLTIDYAKLQSENSLLLSRVQACKELEQKLRDMSDEDLELDGCYLSTQEADVLKSEIRKQGEQIWIELKKKLFSVVSKPYQIVAKEEANKEYKLLKRQYEELEAEMIKLQTQLQEQHIQVTEKSQKSVQRTDKGTMTEEQIQHTDQTNLPVVDVSFLKEMAISPEEQNKDDTASESQQLQSETEQESDTTAAVAKVLQEIQQSAEHDEGPTTQHESKKETQISEEAQTENTEEGTQEEPNPTELDMVN